MSNTHSTQTILFYQRTIGLLLLVGLLFALYQVLSLFFGVFTYAIILAVAMEGLFEKWVILLGNRRKLAAGLYGLIVLAILAVPFSFLVSWFSHVLHNAIQFLTHLDQQTIPALPSAITNIPFIGEKINAKWSAIQANPNLFLTTYRPQIIGYLKLLIGTGALLELIIGIVISAILLFNSKATVQSFQHVLATLAGSERGHALITASGKAIKGVAVGVMGTAFIEAIVIWIGLLLCKVPFAGLLAAITFLLAVIQLGPVLVALPITIWLASTGASGYALLMGIWLVLLFIIDNVVKPILIGKSGQLPVIILFLGVVGGMAAWGFTGMFKGAIILSVTYTLFQSWFKDGEKRSTIG